MKAKAIIITGANGNVGSYIAKQYLEAGEKLILCVHNDESRLVEIKEKFSDQIIICKADISDIDDLQKGINTIIENKDWFPKALIHTISIRSSDFQPLVETDPVLWKRIIDVNLNGTYNILKVILPLFRQEQYGKIVLFGSNVTRIGLSRGSAYAASKAALANLCRSVAIEEAKNNIYLNTISPGPIKIDESHFSESYREFRRRYYKEKIKEIPLKRHASFQDIFGICKFLISEENTYITGEEFFVTGGRL
jgi:NAD(P)-dependent dehydrogenase (short-subunit alcohol dehydrogenase family)